MDEQIIRVNLELVDAGSGRQVWSEAYKRPFTPDNLFDIQKEVSRDLVACVADRYMGAIPRTISKKLLQQPRSNATAYEATL